MVRGRSSRSVYVWARFARRCFVESRYYDKSPTQITDEEVQRYFINFINEKRVSHSTVSLTPRVLKFVYERTLLRPLPMFDLLRRPHSRQRCLPKCSSTTCLRRVLPKGFVQVRFLHLRL